MRTQPSRASFSCRAHRTLQRLVRLLLVQLTFSSIHSNPPLPHPRDFHNEILESTLRGVDVTAQVVDWTQRTRDESFDSFLAGSTLAREALRLEARALKAWDSQDEGRALQLLQQATRLLVKERWASEVAFCLYYTAEILAGQERYSKSLQVLERAVYYASRGSNSRHFLLGVQHQSQGYNFWFLDNLRASVHAFGLAQHHFEKLNLHDGIVTSWNNQAILFEELQLPERADECYRQALQRVLPAVDPRIRFQLHANFAAFLENRGQHKAALLQLEEAAQLARHVSPFQLLLLQCGVLGHDDLRQKLLAERPRSPSEAIEKNLTLAETAPNPRLAYRHYSMALRLSRAPSQSYWERQTVMRFGKWLESEKRYSEAAKLYRSVYLAKDDRFGFETAFPYSRSLARLLDGWIRCLIRLGEPEKALQVIHLASRQRLERATRFIEAAPGMSLSPGGSNPLLAAALLEQTVPPPARRPESSEMPAGKDLRPVKAEGFSILEMWPDKETVAVWITNPGSTHYLELYPPEFLLERLQQTIGLLYDAERWLPPFPDSMLLNQIYRQLFRPLQEKLEASSILCVMHKDLQHLPMELLQDDDGSFLIRRYRFSYLSSVYRPPPPKRWQGQPVAVLPQSNQDGFRTRRLEEESLRNTFPDLRVAMGFERPFPQDARWIHISSHFDLRKDFWPISVFSVNHSRLALTSLLRQPLGCRLLSLGTCDAANSFRWGSPYWLGLSELLLAKRIPALVVSRWKLDELSVPLYLRFFEICAQGVPMDQALNQARLEFLERELSRQGALTRAHHPFFWAGVSYLGTPGMVLYPSVTNRAAERLISCLLFLLAGWLTSIWKIHAATPALLTRRRINSLHNSRGTESAYHPPPASESDARDSE